MVITPKRAGDLSYSRNLCALTRVVAPRRVNAVPEFLKQGGRS
jgi:hypothetical protein